MNFIKIIFLFTLVCCPTVFGQKELKVINKIVAQIGDEIVLLNELEERRIQFIVSNPESPEPNRCELLKQLILEELLYNQALVDSLVISDEAVESELELRFRIAVEEKFKGDREKLEKAYGKTVDQLKDDLRGIIKKQLLSKEMEQTLIADVSVTPKEVATFFNSFPIDSIPLINMKLSFQQIVNYPKITKEDKEKAKNALIEVQKELTTENFELMARIHSDDLSSSVNGGLIEASRGMMVPEFEATAMSLKSGEISDIIETQFGYHILLLIDRKGDDYVCQHILKKPTYSKTSFKYSADMVDSAYNLLKENAITWEDAVYKYSNDKLTKENRGIISNPYTGEQTWEMDQLNQIDQQIYLITDKMEKGDVSPPSFYNDIYERKDGIRIVRLMERIPAHKANLDDDYSLIKMAAENNKKSKLIDEWINSKMGNIYLKIDEEFITCDFVEPWLIK